MASSKINRARVTLAAGSAALMVALVPGARAAEDSTKAEPKAVAKVAMQELTTAQPERKMKTGGDESAPVTHAELEKLIDAVKRLEREKVSVQHEAPTFTDAG